MTADSIHYVYVGTLVCVLNSDLSCVVEGKLLCWRPTTAVRKCDARGKIIKICRIQQSRALSISRWFLFFVDSLQEIISKQRLSGFTVKHVILFVKPGWSCSKGLIIKRNTFNLNHLYIKSANADLLSSRPSVSKCNGISIKMWTFCCKKTHLFSIYLFQHWGVIVKLQISFCGKGNAFENIVGKIASVLFHPPWAISTKHRYLSNQTHSVTNN